MRKIFLVFSCTILFFSCKKEINTNTGKSVNANDLSHSLAAPISILEHSVRPVDTDPDINGAAPGNSIQYAYIPADATKRKPYLFIFIPGTTASPDNYLKIVRSAAANGYYSFGVSYSDLLPIEFYTGLFPKDKTTENILEEYLTGNNTSGNVNIGKPNGFENRIIKMILWLDANDPAENWKQFLTVDNQIIWEKFSVAGHSQGSDHAMYMSKKRNLFRAGFIGGPGSFKLNNGKYPSFMSNPGITPVANIYGFNHTKDNVRLWSGVRPTWAVLNVPGTPNSIDDKKTDGSHQLTTSLPSGDPHSYPVSDSATPDDANGNPLFAPVWAYMNFP